MPGRNLVSLARRPVSLHLRYPASSLRRSAPFVYQSGYAYQRWAVGAILPPLLLAPEYFYPDWDALGLDPPPPYFEWVRYGPDLLLVNVTTGEVADTIYDAFE